jgi:uncharacterized protein (TIGR04255 family)
MKIPKKISPCPIQEAIFEVRFDTAIPGDAIFGICYNEFKADFSQVVKSPLLEIPDSIRLSDPNLIFSPHYKLVKDNFLLQIGPRVFSVVNLKEYGGWEVFSKSILEAFEKIKKTGIISKVLRVALRYVNVFENTNIFDKSSLKLQINEEPLNFESADLTAEIVTDKCVCRTKIANNATIKIGEKAISGSLIDIDVVYKSSYENIYNELPSVIEAAHIDEKIVFFRLLLEDYINSLNPEY